MQTIKIIIILLCLTVSNIFSQNQVDVIFLTDYYKSYLEAAKSSKNENEVYSSIVQMPIYEKYFSKTEYASFVLEDLKSEQIDNTQLMKKIEGIASNKDEIETIISSSVKKSYSSIPIAKLKVYILPPKGELNFMSESMSGIYGLTAGNDAILISIDTSQNGWKKMLPYAIAHEYYHAYWTKENYHKLTGWNLLDFLCFEGRADYFAKQLYPDVKTPWTEALSKKEEDALWKTISPDLYNQDFDFMLNVMFGSEEYPKWGGYSLGYTITNKALQEGNKLTINEWTNLHPTGLLSLSGFQTN